MKHLPSGDIGGIPVDPSAQEEHGVDSEFRRSYALSTAHEEVVAAFAAGQRRMHERMTQQERRASVAQAEAERLSHIQILEEHFGRKFLKKAFKLVEEPPITSQKQRTSHSSVGRMNSRKLDRQGSYAGVVELHARAWFSTTHSERIDEESETIWGIDVAPLPAMPASSFRLRPHSTTEDVEIEF